MYRFRVKTAGRRACELLGRMVAVAAILFGVVLSAQMFAESYEGGVKVLIVTSGLAALVGGVMYLMGLDRWKGSRAVVVRGTGWLLFTASFLLPTSLGLLLVVGSILAAPTIPEWGKSAPQPDPIDMHR